MTKPIEEKLSKENNKIQLKEPLDFIINIDENFELILNEDEAERLVKGMKQGPDEKVRNFARKAVKSYKEMKKKEKKFKENKNF